MDEQDYPDGLITESAHDIGDLVYVARIIERYADPIMVDAYNFGVTMPCPICGSDNTCCISPSFEPHGWFCQDCTLLWEWMLAPEEV